jgi:hypothetical protein
VRLRWPYHTLAGPVVTSPSGRQVAAVHANQLTSQLLVGTVAPRGRTAMHVVPVSPAQWPVIVDWIDEQHVAVVAQVTPQGYNGEGSSTTRYALESVDVQTGQVRRISDVGNYWGTTLEFATDLFSSSTRDFAAPPRPLDPHLVAGVVAGVVVLGGVALVVWRRHVRV